MCTSNRKGKRDVVYSNFSYTAVRDDTGEIAGIMALGVDVTAQMRDKKKIEENEEQLRIAL